VRSKQITWLSQPLAGYFPENLRLNTHCTRKTDKKRNNNSFFHEELNK